MGKSKTKYGKMVTARRRWQETLIALPQLPTINNLHWEVQVQTNTGGGEESQTHGVSRKQAI